jgi:2-keto-3-deoxy-L-rhamnonate aldolase RhmA
MSGFKQRLRSREVLSGYVAAIPSAVSVQAMAAAGADWIVLDQEHAPIGPESLHAMITATAGKSCAPIVRVPKHDEAWVKPALDSGAEGICFPHVSTAEPAAHCVSLVHYPPRGQRGIYCRRKRHRRTSACHWSAFRTDIDPITTRRAADYRCHRSSRSTGVIACTSPIGL